MCSSISKMREFTQPEADIIQKREDLESFIKEMKDVVVTFKAKYTCLAVPKTTLLDEEKEFNEGQTAFEYIVAQLAKTGAPTTPFNNIPFEVKQDKNYLELFGVGSPFLGTMFQDQICYNITIKGT